MISCIFFYSNCKCILAGENLGYAKGNNFGLSKIETKYVLILNPDAILDKKCIDNFLECVQNKSNFAIMAPMAQENDSINFEMSDAGHNAVTVAGPAGSVPFDTKYKPSTIVKFDVNGLYLYKCSPHAMMAMAGLIQVSDASNKEEMDKAVMKFEGTVMMPNVKTRMSDLLNKNVK